MLLILLFVAVGVAALVSLVAYKLSRLSSKPVPSTPRAQQHRPERKSPQRGRRKRTRRSPPASATPDGESIDATHLHAAKSAERARITARDISARTAPNENALHDEDSKEEKDIGEDDVDEVALSETEEHEQSSVSDSVASSPTVEAVPRQSPREAFEYEDDMLSVVFAGTEIPEETGQNGRPTTNFDKVHIHERAWAWFQRHPALKTRVSDLVRLIEHFYLNEQRIPGPIIRDVGKGYYKIRLTNSLRVPFFFEEQGSGEVHLVLLNVLSHEEGEAIHDDPDALEPAEDELRDLPPDWGLEHLCIVEPDEEEPRRPHAPLYRVWQGKDEARLDENPNADLRWSLTREQARYCHMPGPLLLKGSAGSGKTTIAIYRLLSWKAPTWNGSGTEKRLYLTYTRHLRDHADRLFRQLADPDATTLPTFLTIEELCRRLVPAADERFPPDRRFTLDAFRAIPALSQSKFPLPLELLWEEIRGVIKGAFQVVQSKEHALSLEAYQTEVARAQSLMPPKERRAAYRAFRHYDKWLRERGYWDDLDLARAAYRSVTKSGRPPALYDQLIVDEVQDLTTFHVELLLALSRNPSGLFLTGDAQQVIHPSRFEWARVKQQLYYHVQDFREKTYYNGTHPKEVHEVTSNFRSPRAVVELANAVADWRNDHFKEQNATLDALREGDPIYQLPPAPCATWTDNKVFSHRLMVIVPGEEKKQEAREEFGVGRVFTVHEAKGLEADYVLLWGFFDADTGAWDYSLLRTHNPDADGVQEKLRYQVNLFNVAATRARETLFLVDATIPEDWSPLREVSFSTGEAAQEQMRYVLDQQSRAEDYYELAQELEARDLLEQAASNYLAAGYTQDGNRCLAIWAERREAFAEAGDYYEKAGMHSKAVTCFDKAEEYERAFMLMLSPEASEATLHVEDYLSDEKRLAKLSGEAATAIAEAIGRQHPDTSLATLYLYSMYRTRLARAGIRGGVRNVGGILKSNAYRNVEDQMQIALAQLS